MAKSWKRIPQTFDKGSFTYSGKALITSSVYEMLEPEDISFIASDLKNYIEQKKKLQKQGADYLQVYQNGDKLRVLIMDNKSEDDLQEMRESGDFTEEEVQAMNHYDWTLDISA